jgi:hypothetical protein
VLNNTLLNDQWVIEEIKEKIKRFLEAKAVLKGKFIAMNAYILKGQKDLK